MTYKDKASYDSLSPVISGSHAVAVLLPCCCSVCCSVCCNVCCSVLQCVAVLLPCDVALATLERGTMR